MKTILTLMSRDIAFISKEILSWIKIILIMILSLCMLPILIYEFKGDSDSSYLFTMLLVTGLCGASGIIFFTSVELYIILFLVGNIVSYIYTLVRRSKEIKK